ncbi:MAG TPA: ACP S-malonyltransferase [Dermatophilaceae bacterium]|nr:ACP S-malonyltransferase [Dermatophilaceae bacterium]
MLAIVCPGQGSQSPGFLSPWLARPGMTARLEWLSAVAGLDLVEHGTVSDADTIKDTAVAQPLLVAAGLMALDALGGVPSGTVVAGHSVGEVTAAAATGVLSAEQAMVFVRERGKGMAAASAVTPTGMAAVLGGDAQQVAEALKRHGLTAANDNGGGQVVAAGTAAQLEALQADPPARARVIPLQVAGAFHTHHMAPAVATLQRYAQALAPADPATTLLSNRDGAAVADGSEVLARLVSQVSSPVRWDLCTATMKELGVTALVELPPAGTLAGLAKRALPGVELLALKTPDDLAAAQRLISTHA